MNFFFLKIQTQMKNRGANRGKLHCLFFANKVVQVGVRVGLNQFYLYFFIYIFLFTFWN